MNDYISLRVEIDPMTDDAGDLLASFLADIGYESFEQDAGGVTAYIRASEYSEDSVRKVLAEFPMEVDFSISTSFIEGRDWNEEWEKHYFKPIVIDDRCVIHSSFHKDVPSAAYDIVIDPKMAFGTGHHATTTMMIQSLLDLDLNGRTVTDMGTGTGILAILSKMAGAEKATGIEIDPAACVNARENVELNGVDVEILEGDSTRLAELESADIFLANINRNVILADMERYAGSLKPGGVMLLSGFYEKDIPMLERASAAYGLRLAGSVRGIDEWRCIRLEDSGS